MVPSAAVAPESTSDGARRRRLFWRFAPAALLLLVAAWQAAAVSCAPTRVPSDEDWERAASFVRERHQPDELIVFAPGWLDPVGRLHLGDRIPVGMAARMDAARYAAIWELATRGARASEVRGLEPSSEARFGRLRVRRYEQRPVEVVTDFAARLPSAVISGGFAKRPRRVLEEVGFTPRHCVLAVPRPGEQGHVRFDEVDLGDELVGYVGLADIFTRRDIREPGALRVLIDGEQVAAIEPGIDDGWVRFAATTESRAGATVEFLASAEAPDRRICFAAEARR